MNVIVSKTSVEDVQEDLKTAQQLFTVRLFTLLPILNIKVLSEPQVEKDIRKVTLPLLKEAMEHLQDKEWLTNAYNRLCAPEQVTAVPKEVLNKVVAKHLENYLLLLDSGFDEDFFEGIAQD